MPVSMRDLLADLATETQVLDAMLASLDDATWELATPAEGWAVRDQVSHLAYFDEATVLAATHPERFRAEAAGQTASGPGLTDRIAAQHRGTPPGELLAWLRRSRAELLERFADLSEQTRVPWYGPDMSAASSITARLMETWAHGQDIADTLGVQRQPTDRLRHVAHLGVRTFGFAYTLRGRSVPTRPVRVELAAPGGGVWAWGPDEAQDVVRGPAEDFCLVVTQRRHVDDTALEVVGPIAAQWMSIAQAFAGAPGPGRPRVSPPSESSARGGLP